MSLPKDRCWAINILGHRCKLKDGHKGNHIPSRQTTKQTRRLAREAIALGLKATPDGKP